MLLLCLHMVKGATLGGIAAIITAGGTILALLFTTILPPPDGDTSQLISPTAIVSTSSGPHEIKKSLTLSAEGSDDEDGSIVSYEWDFGDGNSGSGFTTDHTYSERGTYTITLRVVDNDGETDTTQSIINIQPKLGGLPQIEVVDIIAPTINAPSNIFRESTSSSGTSVTFSVTATDNGVNVPVSCNPSSGSQFPIGTATVTCTATDNAGNTASRSFTVTVSFISPPSPTVTIPFDKFPDGTPITASTFVSANAFESKGILLGALSESSYCSNVVPAIMLPTAGRPPSLTTADPSNIIRCNTVLVEVTFIDPVRSVTLTFWGASSPYQMKIYDKNGNNIGTEVKEGICCQDLLNISHISTTENIKRITFGYQASLVAVTNIVYEN